MEKIYHYTSKENWKKICKARILKPLSLGAPLFFPISEKVQSLTGSKLYLTGLFHPQDEGWVRTGLMPFLLKHTTGEVLLEIPVIKRDKAFVRDHSLNSPREYIRVCGKDLFTIVYNNCRRNDEEQGYQYSRQEDNIINDLRGRYFDSTTPLINYRGDFVAPEIWLPQETSIHLIRKIFPKELAKVA